jgi:putative transposase
VPGIRHALPQLQMCKWFEVSRSGFYDWRSRPESETARRRKILKIKIGALFEANNGEYGYRRLHAALLRGGERCSPELVRRLMLELGLVPCQPRPWRHSLTEQDALAGDVLDLVRRDFTAERPGQKMVGDITYIPTWQGWLYLATVIDCATRKIVGWEMDDNYKTPADYLRDRDGSPESRPTRRNGISRRPRQQLHVGDVRRRAETARDKPVCRPYGNLL